MASSKLPDCEITTSEDGALVVAWVTPAQRRVEQQQREEAFNGALAGWRKWRGHDAKRLERD